MTEQLRNSMSELTIDKTNQRKYNMYLLQAKKLEKEKKIPEALENYRNAFKIFQKSDLKLKIDALKILEDSESEEEYDFVDKEEDSSFEEPEPEKENITKRQNTSENVTKKPLNLVEKETENIEYKELPPFTYNKEDNSLRHE